MCVSKFKRTPPPPSEGQGPLIGVRFRLPGSCVIFPSQWFLLARGSGDIVFWALSLLLYLVLFGFLIFRHFTWIFQMDWYM